MVAPDTTAIKPVQKLPAHSNITDTLSTKKDKRVTTKKIPNIIMVDNSADTTRL
jgi:hypothetical protein